MNYDIELNFPAKFDYLPEIINKIEEFIKDFVLNRSAINKIKIAVDEACTNIMKYAYIDKYNETIKILIKVDNSSVVITIIDNGKPFDPIAKDSPDSVVAEYKAKRKQGGLGIYLMKKLMDKIEYKYDKKIGNQLTLIKYLQ